MKIKKDEVAIIIPTFNEKSNIVTTISSIKYNLPDALIYVIDDNSPDGTQKVVKNIIERDKNVFLFIRKEKSGRGGAVLEGFKQALKNKRTRYFMEMDADLSHSPDEIARILEKKDQKVVVIGSRYVSGRRIINWPKRRIILSFLANNYIRGVLRVPIRDFTNGFRCYPRSAVEFLLKHQIKHKGFITLSETAYLIYKKGYILKEVPITFRDRTKGKSNATFAEVIRSLYAVIQIRSNN